MTEAERAGLRRAPVQERSAARVERMLDAAAELLDQIGYESMTTSLIARRARVSVGSLYQFFPDKRAVAHALAVRSFERFAASVRARLAERPLEQWVDAVDLVVDAYVDFYREEPAFRVLSFGGVLDRRMLSEADDNNAVVARTLRALLEPVVAVPADPSVDLAFRLAVEMGDAALELAFRRDPAGDAAIVAEVKAMLRLYLGRHLGS